MKETRKTIQETEERGIQRLTIVIFEIRNITARKKYSEK